MKILVVSDTHGRNDFFIKEMKKYDDLDYIIHLGDYVRDGKEINMYSEAPVVMVRGNNDYSDIDTPYDKIIYMEGRKVLLTHGHKYGVYFGVDRLYHRALEVGAEIVLFGHTHMYTYEIIDGIHIINPGTLSYPRGGDYRRSYLYMEVTPDDILVDRIIEE